MQALAGIILLLGVLGPAERIDLARRHAPELRFNAWYADPCAPPQHRNEDHFPMSVERFLETLERGGEVEVAGWQSEGPRPAVVVREPVQPGSGYVAGAVRGYPRYMVGDPPGTAPTYVDVYPDGRDPAVYFAEYWSFYPYDRGDARVAGPINGIGGHRSDWEHISLRLRVGPEPGASRIEGAVYYGHEHAFFLEAAELELIDGAHPAVYVAQGKHASYPEPGEWRNYLHLAPIVRFSDVFHGNGVRIPTWKGELVDIAKAAKPRPAWLEWEGRWGPDLRVILGVRFISSSLGPWQHAESNDRFRKMTGTWREKKATEEGLRLDRDRGFVAPRVEPAPVPVRS